MTVQAVTELDNKSVQSGFPIPDRHGPFLRGLLNRQERHLQRGLVTREQLTALGRLADDAVERLNGIGGVDHLPDGRRAIEQGDQIIPVVLPGTGDLRVLAVPALREGRGNPPICNVIPD